MRFLDKIDAATFKVVDGLVLWLWNEWGVPYKQIMLASLALTFTMSALATSDGGKRYDLSFWLTMAIVGVCLSALGFLSATVTPEILNASRVHSRCGRWARLIRYGTVVNGAVYLLIGARLIKFYDQVSWLECLLMLNALVPTKPRNKKRREARATNLAWSRT